MHLVTFRIARLRGAAVWPHYDDAATIYTDPIATLDEAIDIIDNAEFRFDWRKSIRCLCRSIIRRRNGILTIKWWIGRRNMPIPQIKNAHSFVEYTRCNFRVRRNDQSLGFYGWCNCWSRFWKPSQPNMDSLGSKYCRGVVKSCANSNNFSFGFYNGTKISDPGRGEASFVNFPTTPTNQLG